ncbi:hypothetical protein UJ101_00571 [Flavobacteriaceae bacterium UJ101]|nr:hypothetical protein UJ101_00571 [Flavobacteriaceae bacterium UJ101]
MNKTLNINLGGLVFHIDEEAYKNLEAYLSKIKSYLKNEEGSVEIMQDIESRIAELFREWKRSGEVIGKTEVEKVQELLGRPEDYLVDEGETEESSKAYTSKTETTGVRKLFRDTEYGMIGGVCAGIANYVSIDRMWIRLLVVLLIVGIGWIDFGGTTIIAYIILWIVVPEAKTTTERLQMHGKPINLENIKESAEELGQNIQNGVRNSEPHIRNLGDFIVRMVKIIGKIILIFFGVMFLIWAFSLLVALLTALSGLIFGEFEYLQFFDRIVEYSWQYYLWFFAMIITVTGSIIFLITLGISLIKRNFKWYKGFVIGLIALFVGGFTLFSLGLNQWSYYSYEYDLEKEYTIPATDSVAIPIEVSNFLEGDHKGLADYRGFVQMGDIERNYFFDENGALVYQMEYVDLDIKKSIDDEIHFVNRFEASGRNREEALKNAKAIEYKTNIDSTKITVGNHISIPKDAKWRMQEVESSLYLPVGQKVLLSSDFHLGGDLVNFDYWDEGEMRTWQMTEEGFVCLDCIQNVDDLDNDDYGTYNTGSGVIQINENGIHISNGGDQVIIGDEGINIKANGKEIINIDGDATKNNKDRVRISNGGDQVIIGDEGINIKENGKEVINIDGDMTNEELKDLEKKIEDRLEKKGVKVNIDVN